MLRQYPMVDSHIRRNIESQFNIGSSVRQTNNQQQAKILTLNVKPLTPRASSRRLSICSHASTTQPTAKASPITYSSMQQKSISIVTQRPLFYISTKRIPEVQPVKQIINQKLPIKQKSTTIAAPSIKDTKTDCQKGLTSLKAEP